MYMNISKLRDISFWFFLGEKIKIKNKNDGTMITFLSNTLMTIVIMKGMTDIGSLYSRIQRYETAFPLRLTNY